MVNACRAIANNEAFQSGILFLIILTAACMGLETSQAMTDQYGDLFDLIFYATQIIFVVEIVIRLIAEWPKLRRFFNDFWNTFDFTVVALSLIPGIGSLALVARVFRAIRVLRVFSTSDRMRGFIERLHEALDEVIFIFLVVLILGYVFAITGYHSFAEIDSAHWGNLGRAALSVFYLLLLQDIPAIVNPLVAYTKVSITYFILFYLVFFGLVLSVVNATIAQSLEKKND